MSQFKSTSFHPRFWNFFKIFYDRIAHHPKLYYLATSGARESKDSELTIDFIFYDFYSLRKALQGNVCLLTKVKLPNNDIYHSDRINITFIKVHIHFMSDDFVHSLGRIVFVTVSQGQKRSVLVTSFKNNVERWIFIDSIQSGGRPFGTAFSGSSSGLGFSMPRRSSKISTIRCGDAPAKAATLSPPL